MGAVVVLEFEGVGKAQYEAVNAELGLDATTGAGDWPDGIVSHVGGANDDGAFVVVEVWESQEAQAAFMDGRLGAALGAVGVPAPVKVTWLDLLGHHVT